MAGFGNVIVNSVVVQHALITQSGQIPTDVSSSIGTRKSTGRAINDGGIVAGSADSGGVTQAASFASGSVTLITLMSGATSADGYGIDAAGHVVGVAILAGGITHGFRSDSNGGMSDLGVINPGGSSEALGTNASGLTVGFATDDKGKTRAVRAAPGGIFTLILTLLPGGSSSQATAVNSLGVIVGSADRFGSIRAAVFNPDNTVRDLGLLSGGTSSHANSINTAGLIVGQADTGGSLRAVLTDTNGNGLIDLNSLVDPGLGWTLTSATGINDLGMITGVGTLNGRDHAFLLTPGVVPEPASLILMTLGGVFLALSRLRPGRSKAPAVA